MTNTKTTKRALVASVLSIVLCFAMLIGSTFAWFTDSATTGVNTIQSGNLDMKVSYKNATQKTWAEVTENDKLFNDAALWEPGYTEVAYLKIENLGSLAFKYQLTVNVLNEVIGKSVLGNDIKLSEVLKYDLVELSADTTYATRADAIAAVKDAKNLATETVSGSIDAKATANYFALIVYMPESVGNEANHDGGKTKPSIQLGVTILATQNTVEQDSFDKNYDKNALMPNEKLVDSQEEFSDLIDNIKNGNPDGVDTVHLAAGEYDMFAISQNWGAYNVNIIGATNADGTPATVIKMSDNVQWGIAGTVKNIKFVDETNSKILKFMDDNSLHADVVIDNCVFDGATMQFTGLAEIKNSTFDGNNAAWSGIQYSAPLSGGNIVIDNCKFSGYTFTNLNINEEGAVGETVTVKNCNIGALADGWSEDYNNEGVTLYVDNVVFENNTVDCNVWIKNGATVTKSGNKTSANGEVTYETWQ